MPSSRTRLAAATAFTAMLLLAACGETNTSLTAPDRPSYDGGGLTFGGGHKSDSTSTTTTATTSGEAAAESGGGLTFGGGH